MALTNYMLTNISLQFDFVLRLILAAFLGGLIGYERNIRSKEAGLRTHMLVSLSSALLMLVSQYGFFEVIQKYVEVDPSRIAAQVVSGMGFLGAGVIFKERGSIKGLSTAAGLWGVAAIGLAVGSGLYILGIAATILILLAFEVVNKVSKKSYTLSIELQVVATDLSYLELKDNIKKNYNNIMSYRVEHQEFGEVVNLKFRVKSEEDFKIILDDIHSIKNLTLDYYEII
ncbi:MgtC/SapB family protein [uncultured Clostridium sp.]|jgi:putative Mg2+ transporter-C (MgtC) family protein|uniref:MgtC/SapB family protein n=1 Tax=uncultured Clostridium sp. TaxID=59620 RepID=UPI0026283789|nr:MgtC/SapB family protein [uncultured Clostridium sp.]